jgi:glycosyltransferase involved in cell wall biosynthesis
MAARRILMLTNRVPYPLKDGGNLAMHAMIDGYHHAGWDVFLLSMNTSRHPVPKEQLEKLYPYLAGFTTVNVDNRITPLQVAQNLLFSRQPNHAKRFMHSAFARKLEEVIIQFQPDVIQLESVFLATYLDLINKISPAKTVLRVHNVEYQIWQSVAQKSKLGLKSIYIRNLAQRIKKFEETVWKQFDLLLPITDTDAAEIKQANVKTDYIVAPFGIDIAKVPAPAADEKWNGYHIGAMDWIPNAEAVQWFLKSTWPQLHKAEPAFSFYFAGRHMPPSFREIQLEGVHCMGEVKDANAFIADKKILIVPLRSGGGIRVKILEAMAAGKVVISTDTGMQGIDAVPGTHYLLANTPQEFTDAVLWCLSNKEKAQTIATNATQLIALKYEQNIIISNITQKLHKVLGKRH